MENNTESPSVIPKILGIHIAVLLGYSVLFYGFGEMSNSNDMPFMFAMLALVPLHAFIALVIAIVKFVNGRTNSGLGHIVAMLLVVIIGFSVCLGGASMSGAF